MRPDVLDLRDGAVGVQGAEARKAAPEVSRAAVAVVAAAARGTKTGARGL